MYVFGSERGGRCWGEWVRGLGGLGHCGVKSVFVMSLDSVC